MALWARQTPPTPAAGAFGGILETANGMRCRLLRQPKGLVRVPLPALERILRGRGSPAKPCASAHGTEASTLGRLVCCVTNVSKRS